MTVAPTVDTRIARHQSDRGEWLLAIRAPAPRLRAYVREYQGYARSI